VQLVQPGAGCPIINTPVVDSGANGIADTRAEGSDLLLRVKQTDAAQPDDQEEEGNGVEGP
jgi:hypothetical protein